MIFAGRGVPSSDGVAAFLFLPFTDAFFAVGFGFVGIIGFSSPSEARSALFALKKKMSRVAGKPLSVVRSYLDVGFAYGLEIGHDGHEEDGTKNSVSRRGAYTLQLRLNWQAELLFNHKACRVNFSSP